MTRRTALSLGGLAVASALSLVAVTNAWFINVDATPEGEGVTSALVRYLPEEAQRSSESLVQYGNLLSGGSIDPDGIPLILPGDSLLSSTYEAALSGSPVQITRTSIARAYEQGDCAGTVLHTETRYRADGTSMLRTQRDRMEGPSTETGWYSGDVPTLEPSDLTGYTSLTTSKKDVTTSDDKSLTTTVSSYITAYTPPVGSTKSPYEYRQIITTKLHHEAAVYTGGGVADWPTAAARTVTTEETVLSPAWSETSLTPTPTVTRSALIITDSAVGGGGTEDTPALIPLRMENRSTVPTRLRLGLSVVLDGGRAGETPAPLTVQEKAGTWYFGKDVPNVGFIDLFAFTPHSGQDGYRWTPNTEESDALWTLWDLNVGAPGSDDFVVPPMGETTVDETTGAVTEPLAKRYTAVQDFSVSGESHFEIAESVFQTQFNELYCADNPVIQIRLRYYVRQDEYMEWSQFYTQDASLTFGGATTADSGGGNGWND